MISMRLAALALLVAAAGCGGPGADDTALPATAAPAAASAPGDADTPPPVQPPSAGSQAAPDAGLVADPAADAVAGPAQADELAPPSAPAAGAAAAAGPAAPVAGTSAPGAAAGLGPDSAPVPASAAAAVAAAPAKPASTAPVPAMANPASAAAAAPVASLSRPAAKSPAAAPAPAPGPAPAAVASAPGGKATLRGRISLQAGPRQDVGSDEVAQTVVYFLPRDGAPRPAPRNFSIDTQSKGFSPNLLVVPRGSTVAFPNKDAILHNVYSVTSGNAFDLGTYGAGESREQRLDKPGLVLVNCNVHHGMRANVLVMDTPHVTRPQPDGGFALEGVPAGPGTLVFWHPRANPQSQAIGDAAAEAPMARTLVAVRPRIDAQQ